VFSAHDCDTIYEIPLVLHQEKMDLVVLKKMRLQDTKIELGTWKKFVSKIKNPAHTIEIAISGKYIDYHDAYKSIIESFVHAGAENDVKVKIRWVNAEDCESGNLDEIFEGVSGILVPGGFGTRGIEGKIKSINYARINNIPFFGICLGMQCAVIEFARNECNMPRANSSEIKKGAFSVIDLMPTQKGIKNMGGTMRLGSYSCVIEPGTKAAEAYGVEEIKERHRHRYELNNQFRDKLKNKGMVVSGVSPDGFLVEMIELRDHPWFVACQFHPELKSRATNAHPLFREFVKASKIYSFTK
jgi:CTP synthase